MIQINLLDESMKSGRGRSSSNIGAGLGNVLVLLVAIVMIGANGYLGWQSLGKVQAAKREFQTADASRKELKKQIDAQSTEAEQVRQYREVVANQMDVLRSLDPPDRILWCEKINQISNLIPPNVFIAEIEVTEDVKMVETEQSIEAREAWSKTPVKKRTPKEPSPVYRPEIRYNMDITGLAGGKDSVEQFSNVLAFHRAMTEYEYVNRQGETVKFMDGFLPDVNFDKVNATTYAERPVNQFIFKLQTYPLGSTIKSLNGDETPAKQVAGL